MNKIMPNYDEIFDQKNVNIDFCKLWKCSGLKSEYKCFSCPVLADINKMRKEFHMENFEYNRKAA
jgi:hypothetical protein